MPARNSTVAVPQRLLCIACINMRRYWAGFASAGRAGFFWEKSVSGTNKSAKKMMKMSHDEWSMIGAMSESSTALSRMWRAIKTCTRKMPCWMNMATACMMNTKRRRFGLSAAAALYVT